MLEGVSIPRTRAGCVYSSCLLFHAAGTAVGVQGSKVLKQYFSSLVFAESSNNIKESLKYTL